MSSAPFLLPKSLGPSNEGWPSFPKSQSNLASVLRAWFPVLICACVFAIESTRAFGTDHTSRPLQDFFRIFMGSAVDQGWTFTHHIIRKIGHFSGYGIFSLVCFRGFWLSFRKSSSGIPLRIRTRLASEIDMRIPIRIRTRFAPRFRARLSAHFPSRFKIQLACHALAIGATFLVASADEIHQSFLPNRTGTFADVILDSTGASALQLVLCLILLAAAKWPLGDARAKRPTWRVASRAQGRRVPLAA